LADAYKFGGKPARVCRTCHRQKTTRQRLERQGENANS
jgi:hypothetical protein